MKHQILMLRRAQRELENLPHPARLRVQNAIADLAENPHPPGSLKLTNRDAWRLRVGDYRVIYEIENEQLIVTVIRLGHRRDIYR